MFAAEMPVALTAVSSKKLAVKLDTSAAPDAREWAEVSQKIIEVWHPILAAYLAVPGDDPPITDITLLFMDMDGVAHTQQGRGKGSKITVSSRYIKGHPDDYGLVVHELVHVIQNYPGGQPGWIVEGIADYVRFWLCEPEGQPKQIPANASYKNSYRITGAFFAWIEKQYKVAIARDLNTALRLNKYKQEIFQEKTGKDLDALWAEFMAAQPK